MVMTEPIQCGEPFVPVLVVVLQRKSDGGIAMHNGAAAVASPDVADLRAALASLPADVRAEVVGTPDVWEKAIDSAREARVAAERDRAAAIARAEAAERERDEARGEADALRNLNAEEQRQKTSLRSDLERTMKERDQARADRNACYATERKWKAVVEAAKRWRRDYDESEVTDITVPQSSLWLATEVLCDAVDALTAPAAEGTRPSPLRCQRHGGIGFMSDCVDCKAVPPPDPNEREELGRLLRVEWYGYEPDGSPWGEMPEGSREHYRRAASAVAERVRAKDGKGNK